MSNKVFCLFANRSQTAAGVELNENDDDDGNKKLKQKILLVVTRTNVIINYSDFDRHTPNFVSMSLQLHYN